MPFWRESFSTSTISISRRSRESGFEREEDKSTVGLGGGIAMTGALATLAAKKIGCAIDVGTVEEDIETTADEIAMDDVIDETLTGVAEKVGVDEFTGTTAEPETVLEEGTGGLVKAGVA
jgi:hypothetical protein